jgi:hypothetical protein
MSTPHHASSATADSGPSNASAAADSVADSGPSNALAAADSVAKGVGPSNEHEKALDFANYFVSYGYLYHQKDMLQVS